MKKRILGLIAFVVALAMVITILPVNTGAVQAASKKPKLSKKGISVDIDAKETLTIKNVKDDSVIKWKIANPDVAKVTSKGVIKGKKAGETTVSCTVKSAKKKYTLSAKVTVTDSISVSSQKKLESALNRDDTALITLKTSSKKSFTIPEGDYSGKTLVVDAKKSDVVNNGVFKAITIKAIAANTWTENAQGNVLTISAAAGHIVIPADANFSEIIVTSTNASSNFVLDIAGNIGKVTVESQTKLKLNVTGTVDAIAVNDRAQLDIKGSSEQNIPIEVSDTADGTLINSNIPVVLETQSDTEINLGKGAENSTITASNTEKAVEVTNNTASSISVTTGDVSQDVNSGKNATIDGEGKITNTTTPDKEEKPEDDTASSGGESAGGASGSVGGGASGGGASSGGYSGGGASSSGNLTRQIYYFEAITPIEAGVVGETLKSIDQLGLPSTVKGYSRNGETVEIAVTGWENTDNYAPENNNLAKTYFFTARLGASVNGLPYTVTNQTVFKARVYVAAESEIEYADDFSKGITVTKYKTKEWESVDYYDGRLSVEPDEIIEGTYYLFTNETGKECSLVFEVAYYDINGLLIPYYKSRFMSSVMLAPNESVIRVIDDKSKEFHNRKITIIAREQYLNREFSNIFVESMRGETGIWVGLKNTSDRVIDTVGVSVLFFDSNGEVIGSSGGSTNKLYAPGSEDTVEVPFLAKRSYYNSSTREQTKEYYIPASYTVFLSSASVVTSVNNTTDGIEYADDFSKGIKVTEYKTKKWESEDYYDGKLDSEPDLIVDGTHYVMTNETGKECALSIEVSYYDENGIIIPSYTRRVVPSDSLSSGESVIHEIVDPNNEYKSRKITINARETYLNREFSNISVESQRGETGVLAKLKNGSNKIINTVSVYVLWFDSDGDVIGLSRGSTNKLYAPGSEDTVEVSFLAKRSYYNSSTGERTKEYYIPTSYLVFLSSTSVVASVDATTDGIEYANDFSKGIAVTEYNAKEWVGEDYYDGRLESEPGEIVKGAYYLFTNTTDRMCSLLCEALYYDENGILVPHYTRRFVLYSTLAPGESIIRAIDDSFKVFKSRIIVITAQEQFVNREFSKIFVESERGEAGITVKLKNASDKIIDAVDVTVLFFDSEGDVIGSNGARTNKLYAPGNEDTVEVSFLAKRSYYNSSTRERTYEYYYPDSYMVFLSSASVIE